MSIIYRYYKQYRYFSHITATRLGGRLDGSQSDYYNNRTATHMGNNNNNNTATTTTTTYISIYRPFSDISVE